MKELNIIPPWISHIISAQKKESNISSRLIQLATIGIDNTPRVRTVVFRGWSQSYEMEIYTDKRSQKCFELELNNRIEICWFFSKAKCQFRLRGTAKNELVKEQRLIHWNKLNEKSKSMWSWPSPRDNYKFDQTNDISINSKKHLSDNFTLLKIYITEVDQLLLHNPIHTRRLWTKNKEWIEKRINP